MNYRLQIQIHEASPNDTATIFHAGILWDKETHPWLDLATVSIMTPLSPDVLERLEIYRSVLTQRQIFWTKYNTYAIFRLGLVSTLLTSQIP